MRQKNFWIIGAAAMIFAACSSDEEAMSSLPDSIEISTYINQTTRAEQKSAFETGDIINLSACMTTGAYNNSFTANYMSNVAVTKGDDAWSYSPQKAWPSDDNIKLSFIAFYPKSGSTANSYSLTVNDDPNSQIDPLWSTIKDACVNDRNGTAINGSAEDAAFNPESGPINLKFKHMLSNVRIYVKLSEQYSGIDVKLNSLQISNIYSSGRFTILNNLSTGSWGSLSALKTFTFYSVSDEALSVTDNPTLVNSMLMIPQNLYSQTSPRKLTLNFTHTLAEGGEKSVTKTLYIEDTWVQNKTYNYTINLALDIENITVAAEITDRDMPEIETSADDVPTGAVDLGLSVYWAKSNLGASSYGSYYAWGETSSKTYFSLYTNNNYKWYNSTTFITKYNTTDGKKTLESSDDAAVAILGGKWRMPTSAEMSELMSKCNWEWTYQNGMYGYLVTSRNNSNSIFLPASGRYAVSTLYNKNVDGYYWLKDKGSDNYYASALIFEKNSITKREYERYHGLSIRPVLTK